MSTTTPNLSTYLSNTQLLLQNPNAPATLYSSGNLTTFINEARVQIAGVSESIRSTGTLSTTSGTRSYSLSAFTLSPSSGITGAFNINQMQVAVGGGYQWMRPRQYQWLFLFRLSAIVPNSGQPAEWAIFQQGINATFVVDPVPNSTYTLSADLICYPQDLASSSDPEAIPYPWTDCVPYYAAYMALLAAQRTTDADNMFQRYQMFENRARRMSTPQVMPGLLPQQPDIFMPNRLGVRGGGGGQ